MIRTLLAAAGSVAALSLSGMPAVAATPTTTTTHNGTETFHDDVPCVGLATVTIRFNRVEHSSVSGTADHETSTTTGTFWAVLDAGGTSSGRFTIWDGFNTTNGVTGEGSFTFNGTVESGVGAGTHWHIQAHFTGTLDGSQDPKVAFDRSRCS